MSGSKKQTRQERADSDLLRTVRFQWAHGTPVDYVAELWQLDPSAVRNAYDTLDAELHDFPDHAELVHKQLIALKLRRARLIISAEQGQRFLDISTAPEDLAPAQRAQFMQQLERSCRVERDLIVIDREIRELAQSAKPTGPDPGAGRDAPTVNVYYGKGDGDAPDGKPE